KWVPLARKLGKPPFVAAAGDRKLSIEERLRAIEVVTELFGSIPQDDVKELLKAKSEPEVVARALWSLSRTDDRFPAQDTIAEGPEAADPGVARGGGEALLPGPIETSQYTPLLGSPSPRGLDDPERRVRMVAIQAVRSRNLYYREFPPPKEPRKPTSR